MNKEEIIKYLKNSISEKGNYSYSLPIETTKLTIRYIEDLEQRIDKAIKYISEAQLGEFVDYRPYYLIDDICGKDLLKILKGEE